MPALRERYGVAATPAYSPFNFAPPPVFGPYPNIYSTADKVETFSSDGPRRIFFKGNGTAITPGDFSSTGGQVLQQPLITAADGVAVTGVGGFASPFFGTSAAAPHAAAIAGLIKSANPSFTQAQIKTALTTTAIDIEAAGTDRDAGFGMIMPYAGAAIAWRNRQSVYRIRFGHGHRNLLQLERPDRARRRRYTQRRLE